MREILFRGKPVHKEDYRVYKRIYKDRPYICNKEFVYGILIRKDDKCYLYVDTWYSTNNLIHNAVVTLVEVIPETVSQYTGLKDKNGNKIFEGDILKPDYDDNSYYRVVWDSTDLHFNLETYRFNDFAEKALLSWCENIANCGVEYDCEIIGNIYAEQK